MNNDDGKFYIIQFPKGFKANDSQNLKKLLQNKNIMKIFHYARFDVAMLKKNLNIITKNIFCTKIASKLSRTYTSSHGLKDLVQEILKVEISKKEQSSDWSQEELSQDQIEYALNDVRYLQAIKDNLEKKITVLDEDIQKVSDLLVKLEKDKANALATMNALQGAKSQCVTFIKELHDDNDQSNGSSDDS